MERFVLNLDQRCRGCHWVKARKEYDRGKRRGELRRPLSPLAADVMSLDQQAGKRKRVRKVLEGRHASLEQSSWTMVEVELIKVNWFEKARRNKDVESSQPQHPPTTKVSTSAARPFHFLLSALSNADSVALYSFCQDALLRGEVPRGR